MLLERLDFRCDNFDTSTSDQGQKKANFSKKVSEFAQKGNEGLSPTDRHTCCFCRKKVSGRAYLRNHIRTLHLKSTKLFCDHCPKVFYNKNYIKRHMIAAHSKKNLSCNICDFKTSFKSTFLRHKKKHDTGVECPICRQLVKELKRHIRTHTSKKNCPVCHQIFSYANLKSHMKLHTRALRCEICEEAFEKKLDLRR